MPMLWQILLHLRLCGSRGSGQCHTGFAIRHPNTAHHPIFDKMVENAQTRRQKWQNRLPVPQIMNYRWIGWPLWGF